MDREMGLQLLAETKVIAIVRGLPGNLTLPLAEALYDGGVRVLEFTMNSADAEVSIRELQGKLGDSMWIGAGTVIDPDSARTAKESGASFFVSPNVDFEVIRYAKAHSLPMICGAMTPTEIVGAHRAGADFIKVFPSGSLGVAYFKELQGPLSHIPMIAVGGVSASNAGDYLRAGAVALGVGGSLIDMNAAKAGDFGAVKARAAEFMKAVEGV
jgi:2-dehydro-3-deoxyphosphogluconate aldolase / (4S)-4-hydroxy-2-oxoglutarate aldolase